MSAEEGVALKLPVASSCASLHSSRSDAAPQTQHQSQCADVEDTV